MPVPPEYKAIKIHPSIGIARLSANPDHFVYGEAVSQYKSNDRIKRQAMQFRLFAYGINNQGIEELTETRLQELGLRVRWYASVANRKISRQREDDNFVIRAEAHSDVNNGNLTGSLQGFANANNIPLGQITDKGLFIPPTAEVYRVDPAAPWPPSGMYNDDIADNTCDGYVTVEISDDTGAAVNLPIFGSWIFVTPPDFAPDTDDSEVLGGQADLEQSFISRLLLANTPVTTPVNQAARSLDRDIMRRCTGDFAPGIETSVFAFTGGFSVAEVRNMLYPTLQLGDRGEIRFALKTAGVNTGATPGELTHGLCSPWQFDFQVCTCSFWPAQRPDTALREPGGTTQVKWVRKRASDIGGALGRLQTGKDFVDHVYELGILREDGGQVVETERDNDIP